MSAVIDLRSDTVTRPTSAMRAAMAAAVVGDDVFGDDPTVNRLQERVADYFGHEAGLFVPSGTMSNQICLRVHARPGDELICERNCHMYLYEAGGPAVLSGVTCKTLAGSDGILDVAQFVDQIEPDNEHHVHTRVVALENTHNRGGGVVFPLEKIRAISRWAHENHLLMHCDGARLWNAIVATGTSGREWGKPFDSISVCFSKGLGAPVGSMLIGSKALVAQARRIRKLFGGGMRQVGILAAAAEYAFDNHIARLGDDHAHAKILASAIADIRGLRLTPAKVETNLVWFEADPTLGTAQEIAARLKHRGVLVAALGKQTLRACTHLDISKDDACRAAELFHACIPAAKS